MDQEEEEEEKEEDDDDDGRWDCVRLGFLNLLS